MRFDFIKTKRLIIRRLMPHDAESVSHYRTLPEVAKFQSAYSRSRVESLIQEMSVSDPSVKGKWFQFGITLDLEGVLIGDIGFLHNNQNQKSWLGFTLNPLYWRQGYATEAVQAVITYYCGLGLSSVWAAAAFENLNSIKLLKAVGFHLVEATPEELIFQKQLPSRAQPQTVSKV